MADFKITELPDVVEASVTSDAVLPFVNDVGGTPATSKVTMPHLLGALVASMRSLSALTGILHTSGGSASIVSVAATIADGTHAATGKTTPVDADELPLVDSAASNVLKRLTWANLKATLLTYLATSGVLALTRPKITTSIDDTNGNEVIKTPATASAVNEITVTNAATGSGPTVSATGGDTNIALNFATKGTGKANYNAGGKHVLVNNGADTSGIIADLEYGVGSPYYRFAYNAMRIDPGTLVGWDSTTIGAGSCDTAMIRNAAGVIEVNNGSAGTLRDLLGRYFKYSSTVFDAAGTGSPEGVLTAGIGSTYRRTDGGAATSFYVKESGTGSTGWVAK